MDKKGGCAITETKQTRFFHFSDRCLEDIGRLERELLKEKNQIILMIAKRRYDNDH